MKPSGFTVWHLYSCSRLRKAITTAVNEKKRKKNPSCCLRGLSSLALLSIFSILSMALEMQRSSMRWEWDGLHQKILIKGWKLNHFYCLPHSSGSNNNCGRRLNWGDLTWTWSLTLNGSRPSDNDVSCRICRLLFLKFHSPRLFIQLRFQPTSPELLWFSVAGGSITERSSPFLLRKTPGG